MDLLLHVTELPEQPAQPGAHVRMRRRVDGALVIGMPPEQDDLKGWSTLDVPVVLLGAQAAGLPSVSHRRSCRGADRAVEHLVDGGHRPDRADHGRPLPTLFVPENDRLAGYLDVLDAHGLPTDEALREPGEFDVRGGERAMDRAARRSPAPDCGVQHVRRDGLRRVAGDATRRVRPVATRAREVAIIGFDGHDLADTFDLSTVAQPVRELGRTAARAADAA